MAIIKQAGTDDVGNDLPWFWQTDITCPRCTAVFRLTHEETLPGYVGPLGATSTLWLGWRQVVESAAPLIAALDIANLHVDPAQVYGACPYCGYNPIVVRGPRYGLAKTTLAVDPAIGLMQSYQAAGAAAVGFFQTTVTMVGVFFRADNTPYGLDAAGATANAVRRTGANTLDATTRYLFHAPGQRITAAAAANRDAPLCALLVRLGLALI